MLTEPPPMTATVRSRNFRARNPGYDARRKATQRAAQARAFEQYKLQMQAEHAERVAAELAAEEALKQRGPLLLPAPVVSLDLDLFNAALVQRERNCEAVGVERLP